MYLPLSNCVYHDNSKLIVGGSYTRWSLVWIQFYTTLAWLLRYMAFCQGCSGQGHIHCVVNEGSKVCPSRVRVRCCRQKWLGQGRAEVIFCYEGRTVEKRSVKMVKVSTSNCLLVEDRIAWNWKVCDKKEEKVMNTDELVADNTGNLGETCSWKQGNRN